MVNITSMRNKAVTMCSVHSCMRNSTNWLPLWSRGQSSWLQIQRFWVRFPALPDFLRSSGSGLGSTQSHEYNWGATSMEKAAAPGLQNWDYGCGDPLRWPHDTLYPQKSALSLPTRGSCSIGIVRLQTNTTEFSFSSEEFQASKC
jgi:hypothetical protein